ncbi:CAP domain-containing protein [Streptacidiphilus sp. ASG 303]|uniref:CAP domain-containing protein n=1 Tax=Streptacidiphilus sp. ASG 303 TaxID=2896847 RepID=UPI001E63EDBE|nr:CAP domain-containing protein [Streptacidiphilus sp. ASG 303]MCD0485161.1 CAP domain-containing protein [Streptacidiphilus sp. ASG 303]
MTKHRRSNRRRNTAIAVLAAVAVGAPTVALACDTGGADGQGAPRYDRAAPVARTAPQQAGAGQQRAGQQGRPWAGHYRTGHEDAWRRHARPGRSAAPSTSAPAAPSTSAPAASSAPATPAPAKPSATATPAPAKPSAPATAPAKPSAPATSAPATPTATAPSGPTARVVTLVNAERKKAGCAPLAVNARLTAAAQAHSEDMAAHRTMSHTGSDGSSPDQRITRAGYTWSSYGENVAYGYGTPESVMAGWMSSPGHKRNILDCSFKEIGVGLAQPGDYWTQDFGSAR